jgi:hypothetical protein
VVQNDAEWADAPLAAWSLCPFRRQLFGSLQPREQRGHRATLETDFTAFILILN